MSLDSVLQNLTPDEILTAQAWLEHLRKPELERVQETLRILNGRDLYLEDLLKRNLTKVAVIAAGSSINGKTYPDIDLFLLSQNPLNPDEDLDPQDEATLALHKTLPEYVEFVLYGKREIREGIKNLQVSVDERVGAQVTVSLLYHLSGFKERRHDHPDDLLEPKVAMGAEQLIAYNRQQGSKFLVLSRQYSI